MRKMVIAGSLAAMALCWACSPRVDSGFKAIPPIDAAAPAVFESASFGLG